jgi:hypothetical protein
MFVEEVAEMPLLGKRVLYTAVFAAVFFTLGAYSTSYFNRNHLAPPAKAIAQPDSRQGTVSNTHSEVTYEGLDPKWATAFGSIYEEAYNGYKEVLGFDLPAKVTIKLSVTGEPTKLWTDGKSTIFLELNNEDDLLPSSGYHNVYGMCHEPGHIVMYRDMSSLSGLPDGVGEGWAHYCGSVICDYVWGKLGKDVYPVPFDYSVDGTKRLAKQCETKSKDPTTLAACTFYTLGMKYGHKAVGSAMRAALLNKPTGSELMPLFSSELAKAVNAPEAGLIPESMLSKALTWDTKLLNKGKSPKESFFRGLKAGEGGWLSYDDDVNESIRSTAGSGHAVIFHKRGGGILTAVRMKGSRYGLDQSESVFRVTVLDADFKVIKQVEFPYLKYAGRGESLYWVDLPMPSIKVPEVFFIAYDFNPSATDGIYVGIDKSSKGHSFAALPGDHLSDFNDGEWMIRAQVK